MKHSIAAKVAAVLLTFAFVCAAQSLCVIPAPPPSVGCVIPLPGPSSLTITSSNSLTGYANQAFGPVTLTATGGTPPYTWSATGLPPGLTISASGVISGTVMTANGWSPQITVTDSLNETQLATITITIQNPESAIPTAIFAHAPADPFWQTNYLIVNPTSVPITFTLKFHPDGATTVPILGLGSVSQIIGTVGARGSVSYITDATSDSDGWAELDSPSSLTGVATFRGTANQASVLLSAPRTRFTIPFDAASSATGAGYMDGVAFANADPAQSATITCQAYDNNGNEVGGALNVPAIPASGHTAFLLQSTAPFSAIPANISGQLACTSSTSVGVVELRTIDQEISTLPVIMGE